MKEKHTSGTEHTAHKPAEDGHSQDKNGTGIYTCPMHPEIKSYKPGKCPKCGMDLVFKKADEGGEKCQRMKATAT
jgi:hypothetical protein